MAAKANGKEKKESFRVIGFADAVNQSDIEVSVKAETAAKAKEAALASEPLLANAKQVRVYKRESKWVRCA